MTQELLEDIIIDWFARLPKGYAQPPYSYEERRILNEVMAKRGITIQEKTNDDIDQDGKLDSQGDKVRIEGVEFMESPEEFEKFIYENYIYVGESVKNLALLYNEVKKLPEKYYTNVVKLIGGRSKRK